MRGAGRGRGLGIPTANLQPEGELLRSRPASTPPGRSCWMRAGPTRRGRQRGDESHLHRRTDGAPVIVEAYLLDYPGGDLYDSRVRLLFEGRLRDERRFGSVEELLAEIQRDVARTRPARPLSTRTMRQIEHELYETETMAELCARQGRLQEAVAIYRRLLDTHPGGSEQHVARWNTPPGRSGAGLGPRRRRGDRARPHPPARRPRVVHLTANDDSVTVAWALPAGQPHPTLELFLIQRTPSGVETSKRRLPLPTPSGRVAFAVPALHTALAAVGRLQGDRFVPLARSRR